MPSPTSLFFVAAAIASLMDIRHLLVVAGECPLDLTWSNFTWAASACSSQDQRARCCRYLNAFVAVSVARYGNTVGSLGVPSALNDVCLSYVSQIFESFGIPHNATLFCGVGPKLHVSYQCQGRTSVSDFLQSLDFQDVVQNCKMPFTEESSCRRCLNSGITYVHHLIGAKDNVTLNTCRDAAFVALTSQGDNISAIHLASCFFSIKELQIMPVNAPQPSSEQSAPAAAPIAVSAESPQRLTDSPLKKRHGTFRLALSTGIGIIVTGLAILLVIIFVLFILKRTRDLKFSEATNLNSQTLYSRSNVHKCYEGPPNILLRFSFKKIKRATNNFSSTIGRGRFWIMYKAQFDDGSISAVKRLNAAAERCTKDFFSEMELLRRLHHRHLVALIGFCNERCERLFIYEYMENGCLKDHLHTSDKTPLTWQIRMEIATDVANALEYLHFYCDPSLYHGDIKSSNILLDKNFRAKVSDVGIKSTLTWNQSINTKPVNAYIHGTPGYVDPEYVLTHELTEKSDVYSYGVLLLELITGRHATQDNRNLVEWSREFVDTSSNLSGLVDPRLQNVFDGKQLQVVVGIAKWCTQRDGRDRPSMKQVLGLLYECLDPKHGEFAEAMDDEERNFFVGESKEDEMSCLGPSSSTSRSCCSRSVLFGSSSPQSPVGISST